MRPTPRPLWLLALLAGLLLTPARADEGPQGDVDVKGAVTPLRNLLLQLEKAPPDPGHEDAIQHAWKRYLQQKVPRMLRHLADLGKEKDWITRGEEEERRVLGLAPKAWGAFLRKVATFHTELGTALEGVRSTRVTHDHAIAVWVWRYPHPDPIGPVPSEITLASIDRSIADLIAQGLDVPWSLQDLRQRTALLVAQEQELARQEALRVYEERKRNAIADIDARVAATRQQLQVLGDEIDGGLSTLRHLVADAQRVEEARLARRVESVVDAPELKEATAPLLQKMAKAREDGLAFSGERLSRYGAGLQQGWMVPRKQLLDAIAKAENRPPEADEPETPEAEDDAGEAPNGK